MEEVVLLNNILCTLRNIYNPFKGDLKCSIKGNEIVVKYGGCTNTYFKSYFICRGSDLEKKYNLGSYLKKNEGKVVLLREWLNLENGKVVKIHIKAVDLNTNTILSAFTEECNSYRRVLNLSGKRVRTFVYDLYETYANVYPLHIELDSFEEKNIILKVVDGKVDCSKFYNKFPILENVFNEGILKLLWESIGDYSLDIRLLNINGSYYPLMYNILFMSERNDL